jgi:hypothetical protein
MLAALGVLVARKEVELEEKKQRGEVVGSWDVGKILLQCTHG